MPSAATWVDLEMIILIEVSQKKKDFKEKDYICLSQTCITYEIYETETDSWPFRIDLWLPTGHGGGGRMDWEFGISHCKRLYLDWIKKQGPTV